MGIIETAKERYEKYLLSEHWSELRHRRLKTNNCCQICHSTDRLHVHHINYKEFYDVEETDLLVLCEKCHTNIHTEAKRRKISLKGKGLDEIYAIFYSVSGLPKVKKGGKKHKNKRNNKYFLRQQLRMKREQENSKRKKKEKLPEIREGNFIKSRDDGRLIYSPRI